MDQEVPLLEAGSSGSPLSSQALCLRQKAQDYLKHNTKKKGVTQVVDPSTGPEFKSHTPPPLQKSPSAWFHIPT
jgi:hypothetical protein